MDNRLQPSRILIIDDDADYRKLVINWLGNAAYDPEIVEYDPHESGMPGKDFDWSGIDVLLLDYDLHMGDVTGLDILVENYKSGTFPATILLTGAGSEEIAVRAFRYGITDYKRKDWLQKEELLSTIEEAYTNSEQQRERCYTLDEAKKAAQEESKKVFQEMITNLGTILENEKNRLLEERRQIQEELEKNLATISVIEKKLGDSEREKQELLEEMKRLKAGIATSKEDHSVAKDLSSMQDRLDRTQENLVEVTGAYEQARANLKRAVWKKEQNDALDKQVEEDLNSFLDSIASEEASHGDTHRVLEEKIRLLKELSVQKARQSAERDNILVSEISSLVDEKDQKDN